jgi:uncharacterized protein (DUF2267 family)
MSATGLEVFDRTVQLTNIWLDELMQELGPDRQHAYHVLRAVLHALRDRLPLGQVAHLGAQLPLLVRGIYYEGWRPEAGSDRERKLEAFLAHVGEGLQGVRPTNTERAARAVFATVARHVSAGEVAKVKGVLPAEIRSLWPAP